MKSIKFSIITIVLNDPSGIMETMVSVASQLYGNYEHLIIDGGSSDATLEVIQDLKTSMTVLFSEKDNGIYDAMNKGVALSRGDFIIFMNAGDSFYDEKVLLQLSTIAINDKSIYIGKYYNKTKKKIIKNSTKGLKFLSELPFNHQSVINPRKIFDLKLFSTKLKILGDLEFYKDLRDNHKSILFRRIDIVIANYELNGISSIPSLTYLNELWLIHKSAVILNPKLSYNISKYLIKIVLYKIFKLKI